MVTDPFKTLAAALLDSVNVRDPELRAELAELRDRGIDAVIIPDGPDEPAVTDTTPEV